MPEKGKPRRETLREKASELLDLPVDVVAGLPILELTGDRELRLEGYKGVLFCEKEEIQVDGGKWMLRVRGRGLEIRAMRERELLISGWITGLDLI